MQIRISISLPILPKIPSVKIACFFKFLAENRFLPIFRVFFQYVKNFDVGLHYDVIAIIRSYYKEIGRLLQKIQGGCNNPPPFEFGGRVTENGSSGRGLRTFKTKIEVPGLKLDRTYLSASQISCKSCTRRNIGLFLFISNFIKGAFLRASLQGLSLLIALQHQKTLCF